jgi:hypothetical protein
LGDECVKAVNRLYDQLLRATSLIVSRLDYLDERVAELSSRLEEALRLIETLRTELQAVKEEVAGIARAELARLLDSLGLKATVTSLRVGGYEFDMYARADSVVLLGRAYVAAGDDTVRKLKGDIEAAASLAPELLGGRIVPVVYALRYVGALHDDVVVLTPYLRHVPKTLTP